MARVAGWSIGIAAHVLLAATVWYVFWFLKEIPASGVTTAAGLMVDALLCVQFGVWHSVLLLPAVRDRLTERLEPALYGCVFCAVTCLSLLTTIFAWQPGDVVWWEAGTSGRPLIGAAYVLAWVWLLYSIGLTGFGWQSGFTPWWSWVLRRPAPQRQFKPRSVFHWMRHPVYLGFLGLIWFTPRITPDRALLVAIWTGYVFIGSWLKDRRLARYIGSPYAEYRSRVPGFPGMPAGPLGRVRWLNKEAPVA